MPVEPSAASPVVVSPHAVPAPVAPSEDERWAAWTARGAVQERATRRRMVIAFPILAAIAAIVTVLVLR